MSKNIDAERLAKLLESMQEDVREVMEEMADYVEALREEHGFSTLNDLLRIVEQQFSGGDSKERMNIAKVIFSQNALALRDRLAKQAFFDKEQAEVIEIALRYGQLHGLMTAMVDPMRGGELSFVKDIMHSLKCSEGRESQTLGKEFKIERALHCAQMSWEGGAEYYHSEMARNLLEVPELELKIAPMVSEAVLRDRLKPLARKFGRVRGDHGAMRKK